MIHRRSIKFKELFKALPSSIQKIAKDQFKLLKVDPSHPSLSFKKLQGTPNYSVRVNDNYRAIGTPMPKKPTLIVWFFIGTHSSYNNLVTKQYTKK